MIFFKVEYQLVFKVQYVLLKAGLDNHGSTGKTVQQNAR